MEEYNLCTGCCSLDLDFASLIRQQTFIFYNSIVLLTLDNTEFIYSWLAWVPTFQVLILSSFTDAKLVPNWYQTGTEETQTFCENQSPIPGILVQLVTVACLIPEAWLYGAAIQSDTVLIYSYLYHYFGMGTNLSGTDWALLLIPNWYRRNTWSCLPSTRIGFDHRFWHINSDNTTALRSQLWNVLSKGCRFESHSCCI